MKQNNTATFKLLKRSLLEYYEINIRRNINFSKKVKKKTTVEIRLPVNTSALEMIRQLRNLGNPIVSTSIRDDDEVIKYTIVAELIFEKWQNLVDLVSDGY